VVGCLGAALGAADLGANLGGDVEVGADLGVPPGAGQETDAGTCLEAGPGIVFFRVWERKL
jgi:hypothetical protein